MIPCGRCIVCTYGSHSFIVWWLSDETPRMHHEGNRRRSLGEQAMFLVNGADRLVALRRSTAAMQVTLARTIVLRALASIAAMYVVTTALSVSYYTMNHKNVPLCFCYNSGFSWSIFILFAPVETGRNTLQKVNKIYHFTLIVSLHYLVKLKPRINSTFWSQSSQCVRSNQLFTTSQKVVQCSYLPVW